MFSLKTTTKAGLGVDSGADPCAYAQLLPNNNCQRSSGSREGEGLLADRLRDTLMGPSDLWHNSMFALVPFLMTSLISRRYEGWRKPSALPHCFHVVYRIMFSMPGSTGEMMYVAQGDGPPRRASSPQSWVRQVLGSLDSSTIEYYPSRMPCFMFAPWGCTYLGGF